MEFLIAVFFFLTVSMVFYIFYQYFFSDKIVVNERLEVIKSLGGNPDDEDEFKKPFVERVIVPLYHRFIEFLSKMTPNSIKKYYNKIIYKSGYSKKLTASNLLSIQIILASSLSILFVFLMIIAQVNFSGILFAVFIFSGIGIVIPLFIVTSRGKRRQKEIQHKLPDLLDMLYVSVEAGLGFDMALRKATEKIRGELSNEVRWTLDDIAKGKERIDALRSLSDRTGVDDVNSFITAIIQAEQLGSNIANMLRVQSKMMRLKRRQRAEEAAAKLPIKLIFPLVFFMIPAIFIVILGPALLNAVENLKYFF